MDIGAGTQLGSFEITSLIGKGGMGEVYRARDTKLKRDVAIKILPDEFSRDPDRVSRFQREAEALAALNHQNIAGIYDLQQSGAIRFLIMEFVEGDTLAGILKRRGALPIDETLQIAKQICEGLEAAHEKGFVHRDLKPANIKVMADGKVKVLDFGLVKAMEPNAANATLSNSPTLTMAPTNAGVILGTAAYMSPEQAKGRTVDKRTDIFALGCVLYEMLTGRQAFDGEDVTEILASIVKAEPDWQALPADIPLGIRALLRRCLRKDVKKRVRDAGDLAIEMEEALAAPVTVPAVPSATGAKMMSRRMLAAISAGLVVGGLIAGFSAWKLKPPPAEPVSRFTVALLPGQRLAGLDQSAVALSPDGSRLVYVASTGGPQQLYLREMDRLEGKPIAGTEGASNPFFSPDGQWLGFFTDDKLKKFRSAAVLRRCLPL